MPYSGDPPPKGVEAGIVGGACHLTIHAAIMFANAELSLAITYGGVGGLQRNQ